ncbi:MAG: cutinase family protein [Microbacteriaceae bacterium]|nr:cutinase family protein [Microbacteriaceae bacterium]
MTRHIIGRFLTMPLAAAALLLLSSCVTEVDASETRAQFAAVTEAPGPAPAVDEYSVAAHPEPFVEPVDCLPHLVITNRGSGEPTKGQLLSPVVRAISQSRPDQVFHIDNDYPADDDIQAGASAGVRLLIDTLNVQAENCPEQRFVVLGYSQGSLVAGDALAAPADRLGGAHAGELSPDAADRILSIVLYANPRFVGAEPFGVGTFDPELDGVLPRPLGSLSTFAERIRDYCEAGDFVCQSSTSLDPEQHLAYFSNGAQLDGAAFVITTLDPIDEPAAELSDAALENAR